MSRTRCVLAMPVVGLLCGAWPAAGDLNVASDTAVRVLADAADDHAVSALTNSADCRVAAVEPSRRSGDASRSGFG